MSESRLISTAEKLREKANNARVEKDKTNQAKDLEICNAILVEIEYKASLGDYSYNIRSEYLNKISDFNYVELFFTSSPHCFKCGYYKENYPDEYGSYKRGYVSWSK